MITEMWVVVGGWSKWRRHRGKQFLGSDMVVDLICSRKVTVLSIVWGFNTTMLSANEILEKSIKWSLCGDEPQLFLHCADVRNSRPKAHS
jgi:hypothetical protein